ncbi:hypothetical protein B0O99DRAFT_640987 [Bisporella sp. PMI_857]|nr:hypothetical protein B0O99DRAFT_640987 [Bisporella sp. PMI_857]
MGYERKPAYSYNIVLQSFLIEFPDSMNKNSIWDQYAQLNSTAANGGANGDTRRIKSTGEHARRNADFLLHYYCFFWPW